MSKIYDALKRAEQERERATERSDRDGGAAREGLGLPDEREKDDYRRLRASLLFTPAYSDVQTIIVTSTHHGEGATHVAVGLAKALVEEGDTRVLLVEANLRSPSLASRLTVNTGPGLSDLLAGDAAVGDLVSRVNDWNLFVVAAGAKPTVVDCEAISGVIGQLKPEYDFLIIDTPPVNRYADVSVMAPKVDGVILVIEADRTPLAEAESAKRTLDRVGARIFGVVLNRRRSYVPETLQALL